MIMERRNSYGGTVEKRWWNSGTIMVEQRNRDGEQWNRYSGTVEQRWWNSGTMMVEQWNRYGKTVQQ